MACSTYKVAIIDDDMADREVLTLILKDHYEVTSYEDGISGLAGIRRDIPDAVLLDIKMPYMDGTEVIKEIRKDPALAGITVIAMTADGTPGDRKRFIRLGFDHCMLKPVLDHDVLMRMLDFYLKESA
jgi:two-component system cell cycle response regulator DivK